MKLEFTTTACIRPKLLDQTYTNLNKVINDINLKTEGILYINIDPVPNDSSKAIQEEIDVAKSHFKEVHYRIGESGGNFSRAASWVLSQPKGEYFYNIEDDWKFNGQISAEDCIRKISSSPQDNILQCILRHPFTNRAALIPSMFKTTTIQSILNQYPIPPDENPERWLWELKDPKKLTNYNIVTIDSVQCTDRGREWMLKHGYTKNQDRQRINSQGKMQGNFTKWNYT